MIQEEPPVEKPLRIAFSVSIPISVYTQLKSAARKEKRTVSNKVMQIVSEYFEKECGQNGS